ncbi:S9 family peptidase [Sphingomonas sp.]|jgi:dipeptidyl aminopeptidase/acylaminoacyl peptidase|uniref:S9 family peptidase n=1 Tax=Sphingomonas sp. TaxID=28214 RepID=UPI0035C7B75C
MRSSRPARVLGWWGWLLVLAASPATAQMSWRLPALSADGLRVAAFELIARGTGGEDGTALHPQDAPYLTRVAVRDARSGAVQFTVPLCGTCSGAGLAFAPDGSGIAILAGDDRGRVTSVTFADGTTTRPITTIAGTAVSPRWSPDGRSLAMLATIWPRKEPGATRADSRMTGEIGARVDVQRLAIVAAAGGVTQLISPPDLYVYEYDWLRDGSGVVATAATGNGDANWWSASLVAIDRAAGTVRDIARPPMQLSSPITLSDGKTVAFIGGLMSDRVTSSGDVWTVPIAGGTPTNLTRGFNGSVTTIGATRDGIVGAAIIGVKGALIALHPGVADGQAPEAKADPLTPVWSTERSIDSTPVAFNTEGNRAAFVAQAFTDAPALWAGAVNAPVPIAYATPAEEATSAGAADVRLLEWSRDGQSLQGWLITPRHGAKGLVVEAHGGPTAVASPDWLGDDLRGEIIRAGYALFLPNPRGSSGRGEAFKGLVKRDFGGGDLADILSGTEVAARAAHVAPDRLVMMGTSYGGFLTMLANSRTRLFRALIAGGGIADWPSYYGQNGISGWMRPFFGSSYYDDPAPYIAASPLAGIKQATTPTLLFVGERDIETPAAQSLQYWQALRTLNVPTTLVIYPGEGHAIEGSAAIGDLQRRVIDWLNRWLAP